MAIQQNQDATRTLTMTFPASYRPDVHPVTGEIESIEIRDQERERREREFRDISAQVEASHTSDSEEEGLITTQEVTLVRNGKRIRIIVASAFTGAAIGSGVGAGIGIAAGGAGAVPGGIIGGVVGLGIGISSGVVISRSCYPETANWINQVNRANPQQVNDIKSQLKEVFEKDPILKDFVCQITYCLIDHPYYNRHNKNFYELADYNRALSTQPIDQRTGLHLCPFTRQPVDPELVVEDKFFHAAQCNRLVYLLAHDAQLEGLHPEVRIGLESILHDSDKQRQKNFLSIQSDLMDAKSKKTISMVEFQEQMIKLTAEFYSLNPPE